MSQPPEKNTADPNRNPKPDGVFFTVGQIPSINSGTTNMTFPRKNNLEEVSPLVFCFKIYKICDNLTVLEFTIILNLYA